MNRFSLFAIILLIPLLLSACREIPIKEVKDLEVVTPLQAYVNARDTTTEWKIVQTIATEGHTTHIIHMVSQKWLTIAEVKDPIWWHWLTVVVPDGAVGDIGMLFIGGGNREEDRPDKPGELVLKTALESKSVVAELHNVPNQAVEFVSDTFGPRVEDELIAYGWRKFLEGGAKDEDARWLARMPMTTAAVRALDVLESFSSKHLNYKLSRFVVSGDSKRGWTTWTTGAIDDRVIAIAPVVIDLLNVQPSFYHHWRAYGQWAPAIGDYLHEGIMEWQGSQEYDRLLDLTDPYAFRKYLDMPKLLLNATGDQFFLPDSWQFYWKDLIGEKHVRYVPNSEHSMRETDATSTLISFYQMIVEKVERPDFHWEVRNGIIDIQTLSDFPPEAITLWQAHNPKGRNFQTDAIGRAYQESPLAVRSDGKYQISVEIPKDGWRAFYAELTFPGVKEIPLKLSTGVVVVPDVYPHEPFISDAPMGTR